MGIAGAVQAQEVTSATVSPTTYNTAGETLTFTVVMNTGNEVVSSPSVTSSIGVTYSCSQVRGTTNTNITCSGIYTVQAGDSIGSIANQFNSTFEDILAINEDKIDDENNIPVGVVFVIRVNLVTPTPTFAPTITLAS